MNDLEDIWFTEEEIKKIETNLGWRKTAMNKQVQGLTKVETVRGLLEKMKPEIQKVLPKHLDPARIIRMALTDFQTVKHLNECTPESFLGALMECSQLGLEPGRILGEAYLLPFKNKMGQYVCKLIPGYRGLLTIARRSGEVKAIYARPVFQGDEFEYWYGLDEGMKHRPTMAQKGPLQYVYAVAKLTSGETQFEVMDAEEIERIRERSKSSDDGPWMTDYVEMAKKSVLRRLCKNIPSSIELRNTMALDSVDDKNHIDSPLEEDNFGVIPSPQEIRLVKPNPRSSDEPTVIAADPNEGGGGPAEGFDSSKSLMENIHDNISKESKKDPRKKEINNLKMDIQNRLFDRSSTPEAMEQVLREACLKTKCSMGHSFLTVSDLAQTDNLAWLREIADELGRM